MIPGHGHCWELPAAAPDRFDPLSVLERLVEHGEAPERIDLTAPPPATAKATSVCPYPDPASSCSR